MAKKEFNSISEAYQSFWTGWSKEKQIRFGSTVPKRV